MSRDVNNLSPADQAYADTADELTKRILALIPEHPEILTIDGPFALFKVPGFKCDDLQPSLFQAGWALAKARQLYREGSKT